MSVAVGKNILSDMVKAMCNEAGVNGKKTNHSLRVAGATSLFTASVPERIIQGRTGHASIDALRKYERVSDQQELVVSKILSGEVDSYKPDELTIAMCEPEITSCKVSPPTAVSAASGSQYNNCTINYYSTAVPPSFPPYHAPPYMSYPMPYPIGSDVTAPLLDDQLQ